MPRTKKPDTSTPAVTHAIKGFDANLKCRGFQFAVGETYAHEGEVKACQGGFHAIIDSAHPLSVFTYYPPAGSRYCRVELSGATDTDDQVKVAGEILKVGKEIGLGDLTLEAVKWVMDRATLEGPVAVNANGLATASGYRGAATASGYQGAATASGDRGAATASGCEGKVKGAEGNALFAVERHVWNGPIISVACGIVGQEGVKADTWYSAVGGTLVEVSA
jgi:hypothetical protein